MHLKLTSKCSAGKSFLYRFLWAKTHMRSTADLFASTNNIQHITLNGKPKQHLHVIHRTTTHDLPTPWTIIKAIITRQAHLVSGRRGSGTCRGALRAPPRCASPQLTTHPGQSGLESQAITLSRSISPPPFLNAASAASHAPCRAAIHHRSSAARCGKTAPPPPPAQ
jgi:hypothetical protein